jgi:hypothetical protein
MQFGGENVLECNCLENKGWKWRVMLKCTIKIGCAELLC